MDSSVWDLISIEMSENTLGNIMIVLYSLHCKIFLISMNLIQFALLSEWKLRSWWINKSVVLPQTSSLKVEFDPLEIAVVMVKPNSVGALILTQRHGGQASMNIVLLKLQTSMYLWTCNIQWSLRSHHHWKVSKHTW